MWKTSCYKQRRRSVLHSQHNGKIWSLTKSKFLYQERKVFRLICCLVYCTSFVDHMALWGVTKALEVLRINSFNSISPGSLLPFTATKQVVDPPLWCQQPPWFAFKSHSHKVTEVPVAPTLVLSLLILYWSYLQKMSSWNLPTLYPNTKSFFMFVKLIWSTFW